VGKIVETVSSTYGVKETSKRDKRIPFGGFIEAFFENSTS
jgi:hypothetical protein